MNGERRLRVSVISHTYVQKATRAKLRCLAQKVCLTLVVPAVFPNPPYGTYRADLDEDTFTIYPFRNVFVNPGFSSTRYVFASLDLGLKDFQPNIIQIENEVHSLIAFQALLYRRIYVPKARFVIVIYQNQIMGGVKGGIVRFFQNLVLPHVDYVITANQDGKRIFTDYGIPENRMIVLPSVGVDIGRFRNISFAEKTLVRQRLGCTGNEFVIGYCGRLVPEKGLIDLLQAFELVLAHRQDIRLMIVGSGPLKDEILRLASNKGLPLSLFPSVPFTEVPQYLSAFDALVLPSRTTSYWKEQFGRVLVEAMACGVPIVASDSGEIPHVVADAGLIFPEGNVVLLAEALERLQSNDQLRNLLIARGLKRVLAEYTDEAIANRTLEIYRELLS